MPPGGVLPDGVSPQSLRNLTITGRQAADFRKMCRRMVLTLHLTRENGPLVGQ